MKKSTHKRLTAWLLTLVMLLSLLPTTALAAYPDANNVYVDGGKNFYNPGRLYYKNNDPENVFTGTSTDFNAAYDPDTGILTLNGYNGGSITAGGNKESKITVVLVGDNFINDGNLNSPYGGDITVTSGSSGGTLTITNTLNNSNAAIGIQAGYGNIPTGNVTITGSADVKIEVTHNGESGYDDAYGIFAKENIAISENASVDITCATPNNTTGGSNCNGLRADKNVIIDTTGTIKIDVTNAGKDENNGYSYGVYPMGTATLTKVGNMEVQWKKDANNTLYSGGAIFGSASFSDTDHAINVDETNCYASYRFGTPRTVMVENGTLTGPGVKYPNGRGKFLYDDKVDLTAPDRQISATDSTLIPFVKWTSANVSITNSTSQNEAYIMVPYTDTTVTAHYKAFTVQPTFTRTDSNQGTVSCTLISTEHSEFPKICHADTLSAASSSFMSVDETTTYESKVYKEYNPPGEYVVKVKYNNVTYYSEPFVIDYSERAASIDPVTISGETGQQIPSTDVTVTLQDCTFNSSLGGAGGWITNLPAGLTQSVTRVSDTEAKITVSGTPMVNCVEQIQVTVPKAALSGGTSALTAPSYESANFDIKTTLTAAAATIQPPVAGQHPDMNPVSADPSKYTVDFAEWSVGSSAMSATDTFEAGKWYYCYLTFKPQHGYAFASGSDMTYTINGENAEPIGPWLRLAMKALPSAISLDVSGTVDLGNKKPHETVPVKNIKVTNHLSSAISNIPITLSDPTNFLVLPESITSIPANGTGTFQVAPAPNLPVGGYSTTVTVGGGSSGIIEQSFTVEFSVREVIMLTANTLTYNGEWQTGVTASEADVTIERNSQRDAGNYTAKAYFKSGYYMWPDYTTDSTKDISWSIGKRDPKIEDFDVTLPDERTEYEIESGTDGPYATYDGTAKTATAKLKAKYSGCGDITVKYKKFVSTGTYATLDEAVDAGMYDVLVYVAAGGSNFNAASALVYNTSFLIKPVPLSMPQLTVKAPTTSGGMGKIVGTTTQMQYAPKGTTNWKPCSNGETSVMPGTYYLYLKADSTDTNHADSSYAEVTVPAYGAGVTVSGTIKSYGSASEAVTVTLIPASGTPLTTTVTGNSAAYSFPTVPAGDYTLKVEKKGHAPWTESITVGSADVTKNVTIYLIGDVNRDGKIDATDMQRIYAHISGENTFSNPAQGDVNGDGKVDATDMQRIYAHISGENPLS